MEQAAKTGNVKVFTEGMRPWVSKPERERKIMESTHLFFTRGVPNLFGASESEALKVAYEEAVALYDCKTRDERAVASATRYVHKLANVARANTNTKTSNPEYAAMEVYQVAYQLRCLVRGFD